MSPEGFCEEYLSQLKNSSALSGTISYWNAYLSEVIRDRLLKGMDQ